MNLNDCRNELASIIQELRSIENGVRSDFRGIEQESIANIISGVADHYQNNVLVRLNNVNPNRLADWIANRNG